MYNIMLYINIILIFLIIIMPWINIEFISPQRIRLIPAWLVTCQTPWSRSWLPISGGVADTYEIRNEGGCPAFSAIPWKPDPGRGNLRTVLTYRGTRLALLQSSWVTLRLPLSAPNQSYICKSLVCLEKGNWYRHALKENCKQKRNSWLTYFLWH